MGKSITTGGLDNNVLINEANKYKAKKGTVHTSILDYSPSNYAQFEPGARAEVAHQNAMAYLRAMFEKQQQAKFMAAYNGGKGGASGGSGGSGGGTSGGAGGGGGGAAGGDPLHAQYDAQVAAVNAQFDAQLANLERLHGSGVGGVKQVGSELQQRLAALAADARTRNGQANKRIAGTFQGANAQVGATAADLMKDLNTQGADTHALAAELQARKAALASSGALSSGLSSRYGQLLDQSLNNRQAEGRQTTAGALDELATILTGAKSATEMKRGESLADLQAQLAQAQASAARGGGGGGGRGGGGGGGGSKGPSLSRTDLQALTPDYESAFSSLLKGSNYEQKWARAQLHALQAGQMTPQQLWAQFAAAEKAGKKIGFYHTDAKNALLAAADEQRSRQHLAQALGLV